MAAKILSVAFQLNNSTGNQDITIAGIGGETVKAARFFACTAPAQNANSPNWYNSIGFTDGTNQFQINAFNKDAVGTTVAKRACNNDAVIFLKLFGGAVRAKASFVAFIANGIRINVTTAPAAPIWCIVQLFAGDGITAKVDSFIPNATQDLSVTPSVGFQADIVYMASADNGRTDTQTSYIINSFGAAVRGGSQGSVMHNCANGQTTTSDSGNTANNRVVQDNNATYEITAFGATDFTIYTRDAAPTANRYLGYLAIKIVGGSVALKFIDGATSNGNKAYTGAGFLPTAVEVFGNQAAAYNTNYTTGEVATMFDYIKDSNAQNSILWGEQDAVTTSNTFVRQQSGSLYHLDENQALQHQATWVSFDADGMTLNYSTSNGTARKFIAIYIEDSPALSIVPILNTYKQRRK